MELYDSKASRYAQESYLQIQEELQQRLIDDMRDLFLAQLKRLHHECVNKLKN
jgi:hypothetical protein